MNIQTDSNQKRQYKLARKREMECVKIYVCVREIERERPNGNKIGSIGNECSLLKRVFVYLSGLTGTNYSISLFHVFPIFLTLIVCLIMDENLFCLPF